MASSISSYAFAVVSLNLSLASTSTPSRYQSFVCTPRISLSFSEDISQIISSINKLERSEGWYARLLAIRYTTKNTNGKIVKFYKEIILDLLLDLYEIFTNFADFVSTLKISTLSIPIS